MGVIKVSILGMNIFIVTHKNAQLTFTLASFQNKYICSIAPFTQLHGWWHVLAGYSSYMHIIYCLHHRQIFLKQNSKLTIQPWIGITIETDPVAQNGDKKLLQSHKNSTTENVKDK